MLTRFDKFTLAIAPRWTVDRVRARAVAKAFEGRNYEAAQTSRRTSGWTRNHGDVNAVVQRAAAELRLHARDLVRNNSWAKRGQRVIANNTVGWGIVPKARGLKGTGAAKVADLWKEWADSTACDAEGRHTFYGLQHLVMRAITTDGEVLIRRRSRRPEDGLPLPLQIQVLEADFLDTAKDGIDGPAGGPIKLGVEFDKVGRRVAYWLFPEHPGSTRSKGVSQRVRAEEILHVFYSERPGQVRGVSWFGSAIVNLKDLDEYEDAELMKQKIAACFAAFVTDAQGTADALGEENADDSQIDELQPGMISNLPPGRDVKFGNPPTVTGDSFATRNLRKIAAGLGVTYEDLTGDYSQVNFSSARMSRLAHWANVRDWQWDMLIPQLCSGVWSWAMGAAFIAGLLPVTSAADWTTPPMPMIEPDKEGLAYQRLVRGGIMTPSDVVREQGGDPDQHFEEYAADMKRLDALGIKLDSDVRAVSQAGLTQERAGGSAAEGKAPPAAEKKREIEHDPEIEIDTTEFEGLL